MTEILSRVSPGDMAAVIIVPILAIAGVLAMLAILIVTAVQHYREREIAATVGHGNARTGTRNGRNYRRPQGNGFGAERQSARNRPLPALRPRPPPYRENRVANRAVLQPTVRF